MQGRWIVCCIFLGTTQGAYELPALRAFLIDGCLEFYFLRAIDELSIVLSKFSLDISPLSEPEEMLLKIHIGFELTPNVVGVSGEFDDHKFRILTTGCSLPNTPRDWPERVTAVHDNITNLHTCPGENDFNHKSLGKRLISR